MITGVLNKLEFINISGKENVVVTESAKTVANVKLEIGERVNSK